MKYTIDFGVRARGVQLLELTEEEKDQLLEESLDDVYMDWIEEKDYEFALENTYLIPECDRFRITIKDEKDNVVFESDNMVDFLTQLDKTCDEDGEPLAEDWTFEGVEDGFYLTRIQTLKGCGAEGEFELDEPFDINKLYVIKDSQINDELMGNDTFPMYALYYQRGEGLDLERDLIDLEPNGCDEEQYYDTYLMKVSDGDYWQNLQED